MSSWSLAEEDKKRILFFAADLDEKTSVESVVSFCRSIKISPKYLVHNYGGTVTSRTVDEGLDGWLECLWKNVFFSAAMNSAFVADKQLNARMTRIVHVSSVSARHLLGSQVYATSKALLNAYVRSNGRLIAPRGIVHLAVAPGALNTLNGPWSKKDPSLLKDFLAHYQHAGFLGAETTISRLIYDLCGPAGDFCHGNVIECDGGTV